ncbi:MAG: hypothetical protein Ct9H300mP28_10740 [Pseudomonadota bacterium]|nr:MAG: hypothetical protein Ct9H300mP28_10740 [Pseudomonadota bacterium]
MSDSPFVLNQVGPFMEITLSKGKANAISAEDSRKLNRVWETFRDDPEMRFPNSNGQRRKIFFCRVGSEKCG